ncbi:MAG: glucose-6-phosphate isomerase [Patescibacteria group bacterium]|jgi:glucose-6-phosphate isomerase
MTKRPLINYDHSLMFAGRPSGSVPLEDEMHELIRRLETVKTEVLRQKRAKLIGFFHSPDALSDIRATEKLAAELRRQYKTLVVIGIGGSDLGARAILHALGPVSGGLAVEFIGANTDPEEIAALLRRLDLKTTVLNIVSKSGDTIEPMSVFFLLRDRLIKAVGLKRHAAQVVATTDRKQGTLRRICELEGYRTLPIPADVGGRFSALTPVGLFPAACAGIDIRKILTGARQVRDSFIAAPAAKNGPLLFAGLHWEAYLRRSQHITVLMPYAEALRDFGFWFRQLWAESLGKKHDRVGRTMFHGFTPVAALGATDQHSQIQLYNEGPLDKTVTFIEVARFREDLDTVAPYPEIEGAAYIGGHTFSEIIHAERLATAIALAKNNRPSGTLTIPGISPQAIGGLMFFFEIAVAAMGELLDINVYDQPGVEAGKRAMCALLGRAGYELDQPKIKH